MDEIKNDILQTIGHLKQLSERYHELDPQQRKALRHKIYQSQGDYAKILLPILEPFHELNRQFGDK